MPVFAQMPKVNTTANPLTDIHFVFARILNIATGVAGLAIFIMLLLGAFQFLTAGSNQDQVKAAKGTLAAAVLGGALLIGIWLILRFIEEFTGVKVTSFDICFHRNADGFCE